MSSSSSPRSWTVVEFTATGKEKPSVAAVPTKWIVEGDLCVWPVLTSEKLTVAIKKCMFNSSWPKHKIRALRNSTFSDYAMARSKAKKAELTSDLDTEDDGIKQRKRISKIYSSDSDVEQEKEKKKKKTFKLPPPPKPPSPKPAQNALFDRDDNEEATSDIEPYQEGAFNVIPATPSSQLHDVDDNTEDINLNTPRGLQGCGSRHNVRESASSISYVKQVEGIKASEHCKNCHQNIYIMRNLLLEMNSKLDKLMLQVQAPKDEEEDTNVLTKCGLDFPIKTEDDMIKLEEFLDEKKNYLLMVAYLSKFGGLNLGEFLRRSLQSVICDDLALLYSFKGRKQKEQFERLSICKAVIEAAEKAKLSENRKATEQAIGAWLRRAQERKRRAGLKN